jgi:hypothetical protein
MPPGAKEEEKGGDEEEEGEAENVQRFLFWQVGKVSFFVCKLLMMEDAKRKSLLFIEDITIEPTACNNTDTTQTHTQHKDRSTEGGLRAHP